MRQSQTLSLIEVLRATMESVEQTAGVRADDPSLLELRTIFDRRVAHLQRAMAVDLAHAASEPISYEDTEDRDWMNASECATSGL